MSDKVRILKKYRSLLSLNPESLELEAIKAVENLISENELAYETLRCCSAQYLWTGKGRLLKLAEILHRNKYIRSKKMFLALYVEPAPELKVQWNPAKKYHLAYLIHRLQNDGFIMMAGNKGYYSFAEDHFTGFDGKNIQKNSLKKLTSRIFSDREKFAFICREVDEIIDEIV
jgi:hypothetical protein